MLMVYLGNVGFLYIIGYAFLFTIFVIILGYYWFKRKNN